MRGFEPRPPRCERGALPTELHPQKPRCPEMERSNFNGLTVWRQRFTFLCYSTTLIIRWTLFQIIKTRCRCTNCRSLHSGRGPPPNRTRITRAKIESERVSGVGATVTADRERSFRRSGPLVVLLVATISVVLPSCSVLNTDPSNPTDPEPVVAAIEVSFLPEEKGFAAMIETMKQSRRAYALFDVAKLILNKPERIWSSSPANRRRTARADHCFWRRAVGVRS